MSVKGKILIAKNRIEVASVNLGKKPTEHGYYTGQRAMIPAGGMALCVAPSSGHTVVVVYGEMTWAVDSREFIVAEPSEKLSGKSLCFTGALTHTREYYKALVDLHGGTAASGVTKSLSYLVMADPRSHSTKAEKAKAYGTTCISEKDLMELIK